MKDGRRDAFLQAIEADAQDAAPRLSHADWLDENGFSEEAEEQRLRVAILSDPCQSGLRSCYAQWLAGHGRQSEARQEAWLARAFSGGKFDQYEAYTRRNLPGLRELFAEYPEILVIVGGTEFLARCGFRHDRGRWAYNPATGSRCRVGFKSPILYYRKATRRHNGGFSGAWVV
jgi:uncharacterized protein (TIGR02996 family)